MLTVSCYEALLEKQLLNRGGGQLVVFSIADDDPPLHLEAVEVELLVQKNSVPYRTEIFFVLTCDLYMHDKRPTLLSFLVVGELRQTFQLFCMLPKLGDVIATSNSDHKNM